MARLNAFFGLRRNKVRDGSLVYAYLPAHQFGFRANLEDTVDTVFHDAVAVGWESHEERVCTGFG